MELEITLIAIVFIMLLLLASCIKIVPQANAYILERLGGYRATWNVGVHFKLPFIDRVSRRIVLKEQVVDFAPQPVITKTAAPELRSTAARIPFCT